MSWNLENMFVRGKYMNQFKVSGIVELSRVAYGGDIKHTVVLDNPIEVYGAMRDRVILNHSEIETVKGNKMKEYVVLYRIESIMTSGEVPFGFVCWADDVEHAEEQCVNAEPDGDIVFTFEGNSYPDAIDSFYGE